MVATRRSSAAAAAPAKAEPLVRPPPVSRPARASTFNPESDWAHRGTQPRESARSVRSEVFGSARRLGVSSAARSSRPAIGYRARIAGTSTPRASSPEAALPRRARPACR